MIKRISILSLLLLYLSTTAGFALSLHFCGTQVSDVRINQTEKKKCCKNEEDKPDKCCKDHHIEVKVSDQQQSLQSARIPAAGSMDLLFFVQRAIVPTEHTVAVNADLSYRGPPIWSAIPLTIKNCIFLI